MLVEFKFKGRAININPAHVVTAERPDDDGEPDTQVLFTEIELANGRVLLVEGTPTEVRRRMNDLGGAR